MGAFSVAAKNQMLGDLATVVTHLGLLKRTATHAITGLASTDVITATGHSLANGTIVVLSGLTGGAGLVAGRIYYVISAAANTLQLSKVAGGAAENFTSDMTAGTLKACVELTGGAPAYARKSVAWGAPTDGVVAKTAGDIAFDVPAGDNVAFVGGYSALSAGNLHTLDDVTEESFGAQGTYALTQATMDLNQGA